MKLPLKH